MEKYICWHIRFTNSNFVYVILFTKNRIYALLLHDIVKYKNVNDVKTICNLRKYVEREGTPCLIFLTAEFPDCYEQLWRLLGSFQCASYFFQIFQFHNFRSKHRPLSLASYWKIYSWSGFESQIPEDLSRPIWKSGTEPDRPKIGSIGSPAVRQFFYRVQSEFGPKFGPDFDLRK